jgi:two-component system chemotaxis response regulator CheB
MAQQPIKLMIVDDSLFMRSSLKKILSVPEIEIIDAATNGKEAVEKNLQLNPDVILLDVEMPVMNGIEALKRIMATNPTAVLMFSTLTQEGSQVTIEALSLGALDFIPKESSYYDVAGTREELIKKIIELGSNRFLKAKLKSRYGAGAQQQDANKGKPSPDKAKGKDGEWVDPFTTVSKPHYTGNRRRPAPADIKLVCIGISTGGPVALQEVIPHIPENYPVPILIVQHMPPHFTDSLAKRLDQSSKIHVVEAKDGDHLKPGTVYLAKGGYQMQVTRQNTLSITQSFPNELFKPAVNVMVNSVVDIYKDKAVGIIMTGMGNDGQIGLTALNKAGGYIIAREPESCVVAGMPRAVIESKMAHEIQPLSGMAATLSALFALK